MTGVSFSPGVGATQRVDSVRRILAARNFRELRQQLTRLRIADLLRVPPSLLITDTNLPIDVEAPHIKAASISERSSVAETSRTRSHSLRLFTGLLFLSIKIERHTLRHSLLTALAETELPEFALSPRVEITILGDG